MFFDRLRALNEAGDVPETCHEDLSFLMAQQGINVATGHQTRRNHIFGQSQACKCLEEAIEPLTTPALEPISFALLLDAINHIAWVAYHLV